MSEQFQTVIAGQQKMDGLAEIKATLAGWYEWHDGTGKFQVLPGATGSVMHTVRGDDRGLVGATEVVGLLLLGQIRRVFADGEREAVYAKVLG